MPTPADSQPTVADTPPAPENPIAKLSPEQQALLKDPKNLEILGRTVLPTVGSDPKSEQIWLVVINNPDLPAAQRKDLIEDLDREGLSNPQNPTRTDLALIANRIEIVLKQQAATPLDETNVTAFQDALTNLNALRTKPPQ